MDLAGEAFQPLLTVPLVCSSESVSLPRRWLALIRNQNKEYVFLALLVLKLQPFSESSAQSLVAKLVNP